MEQYTNPKIWGPYFWFTMRCVAYNYSNTPTYPEKKIICDFYNNLSNLLPCKKCRSNFKNLLDKYPIENYLYNRNQLLNWVEMMYQYIDKETKEQEHHLFQVYKQNANYTTYCPKHEKYFIGNIPKKKDNLKNKYYDYNDHHNPKYDINFYHEAFEFGNGTECNCNKLKN